MSLSNSSFILKNDGTLWGCGWNEHNQLGLEDKTNRTTFTIIGINTNDIKSIYCGDNHTFILKNNGTLWGCGKNNSGQLGLGQDTTDKTVFTQITTNVDNIKSVYCSDSHTIILKNDDTLWGCGQNTFGQLGLGDTTQRNVFTQITANVDNIKSVYYGQAHIIILKNDGTLWGCGRNNCGQLGLGDVKDRIIFTQITTNVDNVKSVYCGSNHTFILKNDSTLYGCGYNEHGRLGLGDKTNRNVFTKIITNADNIKSVHGGGPYTFILKNDGTLWGCGYNNNGELGLGDTDNRTTFTQTTTNVDNIKSIYCGYDHTLMLKNDGTLWGCGYNGEGQLGLGDTTHRYTFTQITTDVNNIKKFANDYNTQSTIKIYDLKIGYTETLDTNNFRNIPIDKFEKLKVLCVNPDNTYLNCLISFDKKQTWKTFDGTDWTTISDISPENIILNGMQLKTLDKLDKDKLISGGFTGDLDFKIAMKTNDKTETSSVTKIYIEYK